MPLNSSILPAEAPPSHAGWGAYGVEIRGLGDTGQLLNPAPVGVPPLHVQALDDGVGEATDDELDADAARIALPGGGWVDVTRASQTASLHLPRAASPHELVHPFLGSACAVAAHWRGALTFHAGAVVLGDRAWGLLGDKGYGKSTTLAALSRSGFPVLCDDLLVVEGDQAHAGPRCLDLRRAAAEQVPEATPLGVVGVRSRWRLALGPAPWTIPFGGWLVLDWGERVALHDVETAQRLAIIGASLAIAATPDPHAILGLVARPMVRLTRPRDLSRLAELPEVLDSVARTS